MKGRKEGRNKTKESIKKRQRGRKEERDGKEVVKDAEEGRKPRNETMEGMKKGWK